jgi:hypothetical protein
VRTTQRTPQPFWAEKCAAPAEPEVRTIVKGDLGQKRPSIGMEESKYRRLRATLKGV